jgi:predicted DCC family thiol-disulfide oxidoreductase YuxK
VLKFAWLQSEFAASILPKDAPDSLILFVDGNLYYRSTAALKLCHYLNPPYNWAKYFLLIPRPIRDGVYDFISKNRKKIMGSTSCVLPIGKEDRFL